MDSGQFCLAVDQAQRMYRIDPQSAYATLRGALGLWRGTALEGGPHGPVCAALVARLEEERQQALEILFDSALRTGRHRRIIPELEEVTAAHPLRERFHDQLMLALCRSGRGGEAIGVYTRARHRLTAEHGHTPLLSARLEQISVQSPVLYGAEAETPDARTRLEAEPPPTGAREFTRTAFHGEAHRTGGPGGTLGHGLPDRTPQRPGAAHGRCVRRRENAPENPSRILRGVLVPAVRAR